MAPPNRRGLWFSVPSVMLCLFLAACSSRSVDIALPTADQRTPITPRSSAGSAEQYLSHITVLAHDEMQGRETGTYGIDLAAGYVVGQFVAVGLEPGGPDGSYFQEFNLSRPPEILDDTALTIVDSDIEATLETDFIPFGFSATGEFSGELALVGYGITNPDKQHDDYAGIDAGGRVLLMLRREPPGWDPYGYTDHARFDRKVELAAEKGAAAVLVVNQDPGEDGIDGLMRFRSRDEDYGLPALHIKRELAEKLLAAASLPTLTELQSQLDDGGRTVSAVLPGVRVSGVVAYESGDILARNVVGILEGTGEQTDEYVVIGAHYDHVGVRRGQVHNGADDNASGTAGVIEVARRLAAAPERDRGIVFIAFSAEETGLDGSRHFASEPTVDFDSIIAMLNMDMIGRLNPDDEAHVLGVQGLGTGGSFEQIVERRAAEAGLDYLPDPSALGPSDHASFYRAGVPALFFFTGAHTDLHQPTDDVEKINAEGAVRIVDLISGIALDLVNGDSAPQYAEVNERAKLFRGAGPRGGGVVMGIMPDMEDESGAPGWRVERVFPGGGAAKAGIKPDDRILRINEITINGFSDYREATWDKNPGDVVQVTARREGKELTFNVELTARGSGHSRP